jgi:hypothetical protein
MARGASDAPEVPRTGISENCRKLLAEQARGHRAVLSALRDGRKWERRFNVALLTALVGVIGVKLTGFGF